MANIYTFNGNIVTPNFFVGTATAAQYSDLAENYKADANYEPGTVIHFGGEYEITQCNEDHCQLVAGVVSTNPGYLMNSGLMPPAQRSFYPVQVALMGRVPCKVIGIVHQGDMLVSAGNGRARAELDPKIGAVIGKALEDHDSPNEGFIEVVVGRL